MRKPLSATELRANIYRVLDQALESGNPVEIRRNGRRLVIMPLGGQRLRLDDLPRREALNCTPDELVETTWEDAWTPSP